MTEFPLSQTILPLLPPGEKVSVIDLGARGGCSPDWLAINDYVTVYGFDPDVDECARLNRHARQHGLNQQYFPLCISGVNGRRNFYLTNDGGSNSLYEPNAAFIERICQRVMRVNEPTHRYVGLDRVVELDTITLEEWRHRYNISADIDFIKLDIQGAEYEVLNSSRSFLRTALGVFAEIWFYPIYKDLPLYGEVDALLRQYRFEFFSFHINTPGQFMGRQASPVHFDDIETFRQQKLAGQMATADALYFQDYLSPGIEQIKPVRAIKLAALAEISGQVEYAFEICHHLAVRISESQPEVARLLSMGCQKATGEYRRKLSDSDNGRRCERDER